MNYFTEQHVGQIRKVLFENSVDGKMLEGYTDNYIKIKVPFQQELVNSVVDFSIS